MSDYVQALLFVQQKDPRVFYHLDKLNEEQKFKVFIESIKYKFDDLFMYLANQSLDYNRDEVLVASVLYDKKEYAKQIIENTELTEDIVRALTVLSEDLPATYLIEYLNLYAPWYFMYAKLENTWTNIPLTEEEAGELLFKYVDFAVELKDEISLMDRKKLMYLGDNVSFKFLVIAVNRLTPVFIEIVTESEQFSEDDKKELINNATVETIATYFSDDVFTYMTGREISDSETSEVSETSESSEDEEKDDALSEASEDGVVRVESCSLENLRI